jgi:hypothetical protein
LQERSLYAWVLTLVSAISASAWGACPPGVYGSGSDSFVVLGAHVTTPVAGQRYLFPDGRRGSTGEPHSPIQCENSIARYNSPEGKALRWPRVETIATDATFTSAETRLAGQLMEPPGPPDPHRPLVVMVHGSEKTSAIGSVYAYMLVAQGVSVFVYDKRGTGASEGEYTQNFELLADDAAAALAQARRMAQGRYGRAGFFGGSQGGWVAPLAATHSEADFVAVGYGLVASPIEEDREQLLDEAHTMKLDDKAIAEIEDLSHATARLVRTHFTEGFADLAQVRRATAGAPWVASINGEYSGDMLRMSDAELRRIGRARFDNVELIWDYDAEATLRKLTVPLLWVLAGEDREAPIATTRATLSRLIAAGKKIDLYLFPNTDHGIFEFRTNADGTRTPTRIADGYLKLLADWIRGTVSGPYGHAEKLN